MAADTVLIATISDLIACRLMKYHRVGGCDRRFMCRAEVGWIIITPFRLMKYHRHLVSRHLVLIPKLALIPMPTMATNAVMWSMRACRALTVSEMAKLMGQDLCKADLRFTTEEQMLHMLGLGTHVATAGFALAGLLAAVGAHSQ